ncbi:uncharacterized protein LOC142350786 [Convolutriloba macropyga]|uniref:uncharacterized protein LOC142350786 n=1 Tax=Convolutriloba macropyga TaxID=536237 RepID=UPI003F528127
MLIQFTSIFAKQMLVILSKILFFSVISTSYGSKNAASFEPFESLQFILADPMSKNGAICLQHSAFYCLHGYIFQQKQSSRPPQESDVPLMSSLLRSDNYYQLINWFDLSNSSSSCCDAQLSKYQAQGQNYGLSPFMFLEKLTNYDVSGKKLNRLSLRYSPELCLNVVTYVGFGSGKIQVTGLYNNSVDYLIVDRRPLPDFQNELQIIRISYKKPETQLTFEFFKTNVICKANPWICE